VRLEVTARLPDVELRKIEASADKRLAGLAAEVRRLRRLLVEVYPHVGDTRGSEATQAALEKEVAEIRAAERRR
jgi:hypothetical protein